MSTFTSNQSSTGLELYHGISKFVDDYHHHRRHQGTGHMVPGKIYLKEVA